MSSNNTETRILQMQLENKDFEDGVRQTIKSLEDLEEKLNLKNAGDGFEKVSTAANSVQMSHLESGIDAVTNKFTLMGQIGLQALERISSKVLDTGEKILRAATVQPMIDGWGEFEMKTNSVQTILGGIRNQFEDQPTAINAISDSLNELNEYADKTIYNFAQMTENVGKFTNQGIGLEESTNAIKGIANWAAAVGANPEQMSRAMYNISQSLGAGSMQLIDWRSIRFANMATPEVKNLFAEVAKRYGDGQIDKDGNVKIGKKKVNILDDFESSLKAGWLTNDVMAEAFAIYANAFSEEELIDRYGEELGKKFHEMGVYAEEAATKVRTFSQLLGVLQESLGSGWANTFEILFGGFEQQTAFLTAIKNKIEEIINFQTYDRNSWLQKFSDIGGVVVFQETILKTIDILKDFYWVFSDVLALIFNPFGKSTSNILDGIFGSREQGYTDLPTTWESVKGVFDDIYSTLDRFHKWMETADENSGRSPIRNLANALSGVAGAAGIAAKVITGFGKLVFRLVKRFKPLVSSVLDLFGQIGAAIYNLYYNLTGQQSIEKIFDKIEGAIGPAIDLVVGLASAVVDLVHSFLGIDAAADDWTVLGDRIRAFFKIFTYDPNLDFVTNLKNSLKKALVAVFGEDTAKSLKQSFDENVAPVLDQISVFFENAFGDLNRVINGLQKAAEADYSQGNGFETFLAAFLRGYHGEDVKGAEDAFNNIFGVYQQIQTYYDKNVAPYVQSLSDVFTKTLPELNTKIKEFLFGEETTVITGPGNAFSYRTGGLLQTIEGYFIGDDWQKTLDSITGVIDSIITEIGKAWNKFYSFLFGEETTVITGPGNAFSYRQGGLLQTVQDYFGGEDWVETWAIIQSAFEQVSGWITTTGEAAMKTIMDFLFGEETTVVTGPGQTFMHRTGGAYDDALTFLDPVFDWLKEKGEYLYDYITTHDFNQMWQGLNELLFGYNTTVVTGPGQTFTNHTDGLLTPVIEMLRPIADVFEQIKGWALEKIGNIDFSGIWDAIGKFFSGYDEVVGIYYDGSGRHEDVVHHDSLFEKISGFFDRLIDFFQSPEFQEFLGNVKTFYHTYIEPVLSWINGLGGEIWTAVQGIFAGNGFGALEGVGNYISEGVNKLIANIFPNGFDLGGIFGEGFDLSKILGGLLGGNKGTQQASGEQSSGSGGILDWIASLLFGKAEAAEADSATITDASNNVIAVLDQAESSVETAANQGTETSNSILDSVSRLLPYIGAAAGMGIVGKVGDVITGITGNRKPTIIEQIGDLILSFGEVFKGLGIVIAAAGFSEWVSPGAIDKVFGHISSLLDKIFGWISGISAGGKLLDFLSNIGGNYLTNKTFGADGSKVAQSTNFDKVSSIISSIGAGISGLFSGLQTMYNLVWEVMAADWIMGVDENGVYNFDKRLDRVLGFIGKVLWTVLGNETLITILSVGQNVGTAWLSKVFKVESQTESIAKIFASLGAFISGLGDGIAAMMSASIVPGILGIDTDKLVNIINAVVTALGSLTFITEIGTLTSLLGDKAGWEAFKALALAGGGLALALEAIGVVAASLVTWYMSIVSEGLTTMGPAIYTFMSNLSGVLQMIASLGETQLGSAEKLLSEDLPRVLGYINEENLKIDKTVMNETGTMFRDFGNRIIVGIESLAKAKDIFDKYNDGSGNGFPIEFFREMTEALQYLQGDGIKELYDSVFGQNGFFVGNGGNEEQNLDGLNTFFNTLGSLGYVITEYSESDIGANLVRSGTKVETTKEGLDAFQDAFAGVQSSFHLLMTDISNEGFDIKKIESLGDFIKKIAEAGKTFADTFYYESKFTKMYESTSPVTQFAGWLQSMGTGVRQLNDSLKTGDKYDINYTQLESALKSLLPMTEIEKTIYEYSKLTKENGDFISSDHDFMSNTQDWIDAVLPRMTSIGTGLHNMAAEIKPEDVTALTSSSGALTSLASFMSQDLYPDIQTMSTEQISGYASVFGDLKKSLLMPEDGKNTIADTIQQIMTATGGNEIEMTITPVIDDTTPGGKLLSSIQSGDGYGSLISMQMTSEDVQGSINDAISSIHEVNQSIVNLMERVSIENAQNMNAINSLGEDINNVATAISRMQIYLDTGVIAGAVDEELGIRMLLAGRTGG